MNHLNTVRIKVLQVKNVDSTFTVQLELKKSFAFDAVLVLLK